MEENIKERELMDESEFEDYIHKDNSYNPAALRRFKSTKRAIKRGLLLPNGMIVPKRPYHNRANTSKRKHTDSREDNTIKKYMYAELKKQL